MKNSLRIMIMGVLLVLMLAGCAPDKSEAYVQGTWAFANEFNDPRSTELHVLNEWWFGAGRYYYIFEVAVGFPLQSEGRYRIIENTEDRLVIELFFVQGNAPLGENQQILLIPEPETDSLRINKILYDRAGP